MTKRSSMPADCLSREPGANAAGSPAAALSGGWRGARAARFPAGLRIGLAASLLALCAGAQAQWAWRDNTGGTTYSDTPPPPDIRPELILRRPGITPSLAPAGGAQAEPANSSGNGAPPRPSVADPATRPAGPKTLAEQDADFRKRREDRLKAEQKQADEAAKAAARRENCAQARGYLEMVQQGTRLMRPNPDGTRGYVDDAGRAEEAQKAQDRIAKDCE